MQFKGASNPPNKPSLSMWPCRGLELLLFLAAYLTAIVKMDWYLAQAGAAGSVGVWWEVGFADASFKREFHPQK